MILFPQLEGRFGYVNLDEFAKEHTMARYGKILDPSPMLDPSTCQKMIDDCHHRFKLFWSYGGWMEDRSTLWRGNYLAEGELYMHLGVDFNVPVGTLVALSMPGKVVRVDTDHPLKHGWGGRVVIALDEVPFVLIYAHIDRICLPGELLEAGSKIGTVAPPERNGHWYPHLHVQAMTRERYEQFLNKPEELDGYGPLRYRSRLAWEFPDPMQFISLV